MARTVLLVTVTLASLATASASAAALLDDHFNDSVLATNTSGVGDGFTLVENTSGTGGSATEAGTIATITEGSVSRTTGIISDNAIDFSNSSNTYTVEWDVDTLASSGSSTVRRSWYVLQTNSNFIYSSATDNQFILIINDAGNVDDSSELIYRKDSTATTLGTNSLGDYSGNDADGFTVRMVLDATGYTISSVGLDATNQVALSGSWGVDSNPTYADLFGDGSMFVSTYLQDLGATGVQTSIDRISVTAVPEPGSLAIMVLGGLMLIAARRRR